MTLPHLFNDGMLPNTTVAMKSLWLWCGACWLVRIGIGGESTQGPRPVGYLGGCFNPVPSGSPNWPEKKRSLGPLGDTRDCASCCLGKALASLGGRQGDEGQRVHRPYTCPSDLPQPPQVALLLCLGHKVMVGCNSVLRQLVLVMPALFSDR